jgi:Icc protein
MWRFAHLTDTHLASMVDGEWNNRFLCTMMPEMINCLRRDLERLSPDFLLVTGDIAGQHTRDAVFAARDLLDSLGVPYYPAGGNHDFVLRDSRRWFLEAYTARLPEEDTVYSFTHKGLHFCVLDPWWKWRDSSLCPFSDGSIANILDVSVRGARWALPPHQFGWLEDDLSENAGLPTVIAIHYPLVPVPRRMRRPGFKDAGHLDNGSMVLDLLARHPQVKAVFSGHMHMHFIERRGGIANVVTGSMPEFPCEYRDVHVYDDRIDVHTCGLSDKSFARRSLIDENDWTAGQPQDRTASISLADR